MFQLSGADIKAKAALLIVLLAVFVVNQGDAWHWVKHVWHGAKTIWNKHSWIRKAVHHGSKVLGDVRKLRELDEENYDDYMARLKDDIASDFDKDQANDFLEGLDEMRKLSDDEFKKLEDISAEYTAGEEEKNTDDDAIKALVRQLTEQQ